jgi:hypothetical protein
LTKSGATFLIAFWSAVLASKFFRPSTTARNAASDRSLR